MNRDMEEKAAVKRADLWAAMGYPVSPQYLQLDQYQRDFRGRIWFVSDIVFEQAQAALKIILCPKCIKDVDSGGLEGTRFYITVEDDVMTVFPALGHFVCHFCGFEEWHPLKFDPRATAARTAVNPHKHELPQESWFGGVSAPLMRGVLGGITADQSAAEANFNAVMQGRGVPQSVFTGMTEEEKLALHRLYNTTAKPKKSQP